MLNLLPQMKWKFYKYEGTGNDFILFDERGGVLPLSTAMIKRLCDRHFGIGADGVLFLQPEPGYAFRMKYYNADGSPATFCGNGGRCISAFARMLGVAGDAFEFVADDGNHHARIVDIQGDKIQVDLSMQDAVIYSKFQDGVYLNTGTCHFVKFVPDPDQFDLLKEAPPIRYDERFSPQGVNVNYAGFRDGKIYIRTYEKGVENETLSCGTGVTACAVAASLGNGCEAFEVVTKGGELEVAFSRKGEQFKDIRLKGPTRMVFTGEILIDI
jgi:diaminopimelate epimerase